MIRFTPAQVADLRQGDRVTYSTGTQMTLVFINKVKRQGEVFRVFTFHYLGSAGSDIFCTDVEKHIHMSWGPVQ